MEGIAALSLASNTFQVIDFSQQILSANFQMYRNGSVNDHVTLDPIAQDLQNANNHLLTTLNLHRGQYSANDSLAITDLAAKSKEVADKLLLQVQKDGRGRTFQSICSGVKAIWNNEKILETLTQLQSLRDAIEYRIVISLRATADQEVELINVPDSRTSAILKAVIDSNAD